ncbi:hypothetical protein CJ202_07020 [Corynebacterium parakroppenstedtii]|nr:hypothetical protein CJ202_07020 [Corynebacterium kroppenstedtii]
MRSDGGRSLYRCRILRKVRWKFSCCLFPPHSFSILHRGNERRRGLPREESSRVLVWYERKVAVEAIVVLELIRASRTQPVFASSAAQMASDLHDVITGALACLEVLSPSAVARQVSALIGGRMTAQLYSGAKAKEAMSKALLVLVPCT